MKVHFAPVIYAVNVERVNSHLIHLDLITPTILGEKYKFEATYYDRRVFKK
jgi:hypothetical protein